MKSPPNKARRWSDESTKERAAVDALLDAARGYAPGVGVTFAEVEYATRPKLPFGGRRVPRFALTMALPVMLGGLALSRGWLQRPAAATFIDVPAGETARVARRGRFHLSLRGPGALELSAGGDERVLHLEQGDLQVANDGETIVVDVTGHKVEIAPASTVTLFLPARGGLRVETVAGAAARLDGVAIARALPSAADVPREPVAVAAPPAATALPPSESPPAATSASPAAVSFAPVSAGGEEPRPVPRRAAVEPAATTLGAADADEIAGVREALERLRSKHDPAAALRLLDAHEQRFPRGLLHEETAVVRVEALLALGRSTEALRAIEALPARALNASVALRLARAELRAASGRCPEALADLGVLATQPADDETKARIERDRGRCLRTPQRTPGL